MTQQPSLFWFQLREVASSALDFLVRTCSSASSQPVLPCSGFMCEKALGVQEGPNIWSQAQNKAQLTPEGTRNVSSNLTRLPGKGAGGPGW